MHDALLIEAPIEQIGQHIAITEAAMRKASFYVLDGFELRVDCKLVAYPDRFIDPRGQVMWSAVCSILGETQGSVTSASEYSQQ